MTTSANTNTTTITTDDLSSSSLVVSPPVPPPFPTPTVIEENDYITAVGLCGVNGYEAEVNQTIGLCREARTDINLLLAVAKVKSHSYTVRKKNRLMYACLTGNARWFRTLFRMTGKIDIVNLRTVQNGTLYHLVCTLPVTTNFNTNRRVIPNRVPERLQILEALLTTNIDMNAQTNVTMGSKSAFDIVAHDSKSFNINYQNQPSFNDGQVQVIRWWLDHLYRFDNENLNRCLPWLAYDDQLEAVQCICRMENMNLNIEITYGWTALLMAVCNGHTSVVEELLSYYPHRLTATHINHQDTRGYTALHSACENNHIDIAKALCRLPDVDLNLVDQNGYTPLMIAVCYGYLAIVEELLSYYPHRLKGTTFNQQNHNSYTALHVACEHNHVDIVKVLCRLPDVDLNLENDIGHTPLMVAVENGHLAIVEELLTCYPHRLTDLNHQSKYYGDTAVYLASENNDIDILQRLCRVPDVDLNLSSFNGNTSLLIAVENRNMAIINILLQYVPDRIDIHQRRDDRETAMSIAQTHVFLESTEIVEALRAHGARY